MKLKKVMEAVARAPGHVKTAQQAGADPAGAGDGVQLFTYKYRYDRKLGMPKVVLELTPEGRKAIDDALASYIANPPEYMGKSAAMSRDRIQAQYARHPQESLERLAARLARNKWGRQDVVREDGAHAEEFGITGEDKEYLDRYVIARIAEQYDRRARLKQAIMRKLWEKQHNGESFDAALPARMARFRQYEGSPFGRYDNPVEQAKYDSQPPFTEEEWEKYLKTAAAGEMRKKGSFSSGLRNFLIGTGAVGLGVGGGMYLGTKNLANSVDNFTDNVKGTLTGGIDKLHDAIGKNVLWAGLGIGGAIGIPILMAGLRDRIRKNRRKREAEEAGEED